ncbi:MAG TPA: hypothetical protein VK610_07905 [Rhodothermales bacterium]|nr:hypothetical protein [Rhodothermales bacterium]
MRLLVLLACALMPALAAAQHAPVTAVDATLQPFAHLVGEWEGPAWYLGRDGARVPLRQHESVQPLLGGHLLLVQGTGRAVDADGGAGEVVFQAVGVISYDAEAGRHYFDAYHDGSHLRTELTPTEGGGFTWSIEAGARPIRYVMRLDEAGRWVETGYVQRGDSGEMAVIELTVTRQTETP